MALVGEASRIVGRVQELRDERDELLDILRIVAECHEGDRNGCSEVRVPWAVMQEIVRLTGGEQ